MNPIASHLERVATRLNRVALQRALYATLGAAGCAVAIYVLATRWLSGPALPFLGAALGLLWTLIALRSYRQMSTQWAGDLVAARWIEQRVALEQRLITLISTRGELGSSPLWAELESDNYARLPSWSDEPLGIPTIPANVAILALGIVAAALAISNWQPSPSEHPPPLRTQSESAVSPHGAMAREGAGRESPTIVPGSDPGGPGAARSTDTGSGLAIGDAGSASGPGTNPADHPSTTASAAGPERNPPSTANRSEREPRADMQRSLAARTTLAPPQAAPEQKRTSRETAAAAPDSSREERFDESEARETAPGQRPDQPREANEARGTRPGDTPGAGPLFAREPVEPEPLAPGPDFALPLRAAAGEGTASRDPEASMQSSIARGKKVPQRAASNIRRQQIPPEYESALLRIFERNP